MHNALSQNGALLFSPLITFFVAGLANANPGCYLTSSFPYSLHILLLLQQGLALYCIIQ